MCLAGEAYWRSDVDFADLRTSEREVVKHYSISGETYLAIYDLRKQTKN